MPRAIDTLIASIEKDIRRTNGLERFLGPEEYDITMQEYHKSLRRAEYHKSREEYIKRTEGPVMYYLLSPKAQAERLREYHGSLSRALYHKRREEENG